jgi:hypothetical protein
MSPAGHPARTAVVVALVVVSLLGLVVHNVADLPGKAWLGPATVVPTAVYVLLAVGWLSPVRRIAAWLLLGWAWLHAIGGGLLSVLPIPLWPYRPEQSLRHYTFHALYAMLQIPLLIVLTQYVRRTGAASAVISEPGGSPAGPSRSAGARTVKHMATR